MLFSGTNTYAGPTTISSGGIQFKGPVSFYNADTNKWTPAYIAVNSGCTLGFSIGGAGEFTGAQAGTIISNLTTGINNNGLKAGSTIYLDPYNAGGTPVTISADITDSTGPGGGLINLTIGNHDGSAAPQQVNLTGNNTYSGQTRLDRYRGITVGVTSFNSVNGGNPPLASSSLGRPTTVANGTILMGRNDGTPEGLLYSGAGETTDRVINNAGANNSTLTIDQSGSGLLKFTSPLAGTGCKLYFQGSTAGTGEFAGAIPAGWTIYKSGTGTWTLSGINAFTATLTINGGTLEIGGAGQLNSGAYAGNIANSGTFRYNSSAPQTLSGVISGAGALVKAGSGKLTLAGASTYTGSTTLSNGVANAGIAEVVNTTGPFGKQLATAGGTILFYGGTLQYSSVNSNDYSGRFSTNGSQQVSIDPAGQTVTFGNALKGAGTSLTVNDTAATKGLLVLAATNSYDGSTTVSNGVLRLTSATALATNTTVALFAGASTGKVDLAFSGTNKVTKLYINGADQGNGTFGTNGVTITGTGAGFLQVGEGPPTPTGLAALPLNTRVLLTWNTNGADGYKLWRSVTNGGPYDVIVASNITSYLDTGLINGTNYYYVVSATNSMGESGKSDQVTATPGAPPAPAFLPGSGVSSVNAGLGARITFGATNQWQYRVVYKDDLLSTNDWQPVADWQTATNTAPLTVTDPAATNAIQRFYRIQIQ